LWNPTSRKGREKWGTLACAGIKVKGNGQECPFHTSGGANSRFLTGLGARFGMTSLGWWLGSE
jgi:hypothetical protein